MSKKIFFIGIGGVGMTALALLSKKLGFLVEGSDVYYSDNVILLEKAGVQVYIGHDKNNVTNQNVVVYSSAIPKENVELIQAEKNNITILSRAEYLRCFSEYFSIKIGVCGSHGKTTATSLIGNLIIEEKLPCTVALGGESVNFGCCHYSGNKIFLSEICEYKRNIDKFYPSIAVCLNVDNDHLECYKNFEELKQSFYNFLHKATYKIINFDDENLKELKGENVVTFSLENFNANYFAKITRFCEDTLFFDVYKKGKFYFSSQIKSICRHNLYNVLACVAVSNLLGVDKIALENSFKRYLGVKRRMEYLGKNNNVKYFCDYAHHPTEIESTLQSFKKAFHGDFTVVFQPHTYSRTKILFNQFLKVLGQADSLIIYKTYPSRETEKDGMSGYDLALALNCAYAVDTKKISDEIIRLNKKVVLFLGAGDIYEIGKYLANKNYNSIKLT